MSSNYMTYDTTTRTFIWHGGYDTKDLPKNAEFTWNKLVERKWATQDPAKALKLLSYATSSAREVLDKLAQERQQNLAMSRAANMEVELVEPEGLSYLPYQRVGIHWALQREGTLIGDDMGLGKTIQGIGVINNSEATRILIVCPKSLKLNWERELAKWLTRDLTVGQVTTKEIPDTDILIVNYDILHKVDLDGYDWDLIIADELHKCKNRETIRSKAMYKLQATRRVGLTGTPICNKPAELFPLIHWLDPQKFDNWWKYAQRYCGATKVSIGRDKTAWNFDGATNLEELQTELRSSLMIRRRKVDVLKELPAKRRSVVVIPSNGATKVVEAEMAAYEKYRAQLEEALAERDLAAAGNDGPGYREAVQKLFALNGLMLQEISKHRAEVALEKAPHVVEHIETVLEDNDDYKIVVMAHHKAVVDLLMERLAKYNPVKVTGSVSERDRQAAVDSFQTDPKVQVFVGNILAAGVGLTLTAASHMVFAELDWVPGNVSQAEDRIHRYGQLNSVLIEHLVFNNSLDAKMAKTIVKKQELIDKALDDEVVATDPVLVPDEEPTVVQKAARAVVALTTQQVHAVQEALRILAGFDTDHAAAKNDIGFNRYDTRVGHSLARAHSLSEKQAALGYRLATKYQKQLPTRIVEVLKGAIV